MSTLPSTSDAQGNESLAMQFIPSKGLYVLVTAANILNDTTEMIQDDLALTASVSQYVLPPLSNHPLLASPERLPLTIQQNSLKCTSTTSQAVHGHLTLGKTLTKTTAPPIIANAIGIKHEKLQLNIVDKNIAGSYLFILDKMKSSIKTIPDIVIEPKVLAHVDTSVLDDLIDIYPSYFKSAILKLDIEGFEAYALQNANILFDKTEIHAIYMEFGKLIELKSSNEMVEAIKYMINFLKIRNYEPYE
ncbi:unnamed protein product, partial [Didymodactylos carnosus]